jgi:hypothetical protein
MSTRWGEIIDFSLGAAIWVEFTTVRGKVIEYTVVLLLPTTDGMKTIRVYDAAHGFNEMHRYTRDGGKQPGVVAHSGTLGEGMHAAISQIKVAYLNMIEGWK